MQICLNVTMTMSLSDRWYPYFVQNVAYELVVEHGDAPGSQCEHVFLANESNPLSFSASNLECLKSGIEDFVLKHGYKKCGSYSLSFQVHIKFMIGCLSYLSGSTFSILELIGLIIVLFQLHA